MSPIILGSAKDRTATEVIQRRTNEIAKPIGMDSDQWFDCKYPGEPRWRIDERWIEFECGCRAERCVTLHGAKLINGLPADPVIFFELPEQAVYDHVCHFHHPAMNVRCGFIGHGMNFEQWHRMRRRRLMGRTK